MLASTPAQNKTLRSEGGTRFARTRHTGGNVAQIIAGHRPCGAIFTSSLHSRAGAESSTHEARQVVWFELEPTALAASHPSSCLPPVLREESRATK